MKLNRYAGTWLALCCIAGFSMSALAEPVAKDLILKGDAKCTGCHDEADEPTGRATMLELNPGVLSIAKTAHGVKADGRTPTCTDCHGESENHRGYKGKDKPPAPDRSFRKTTATPASARNEACLACHKGDSRSHWEGSQHANSDVACNACHKVHAEHDKVREKLTQAEVCFSCHKSQRAETHKLSTHPLDAGKMACSDCHNPHGSVGPKLLVKKSVNETCYTCHAEKRGPFLWEHQPVIDDCSNCHTPHGASTTPLLKTRTPFLCQQCHQDHGATIRAGSALPGSTATQRPSPIGNGRMCLNCHSMIHGSNSPGGAAFNR